MRYWRACQTWAVSPRFVQLPNNLHRSHVLSTPRFASSSTTQLAPTRDRQTCLSMDHEFCCILEGYPHPCGTCPFPSWILEELAKDPNHGKGRRRAQHNQHHFRRVSVMNLSAVEQAKQVLQLDDDQDVLTLAAVKKAFRLKALEFHPDKKKDPDAKDKFAEILQAYELLVEFVK